MYDIFSVRPHPLGGAVLLISEKFAANFNLMKKKKGYISFGVKKCFIEIVVSPKPSDSEILLPQSIIDYLHIPEYPQYEVKIKDNEISIGPCLGILAVSKEKDLTKRKLNDVAMNVLDYKTIRGAVLTFSLEKVNPQDLTVEGYCYNHSKDAWEKGVFPYPSAIYNRTSMNENWQNHFLTVLGDKVFNNHQFDKWDMYQWFSKESDIAPHLPFTMIYQSKQDLFDMLKKFGKVYAKPIWGMKGFGVMKISSEEGRIVFSYREDEENKVVSAKKPRETEKAIDQLLTPGKHIIQQGLELLKYKGGVVDFRVVMQKNQHSDWVCSSIVSRSGAKASVVSNISSGGAAYPPAELIKEALSLPDVEVFKVKERMISLCTRICRTLDSYGMNYGTLGMDLGLDSDKNLWLIEINNRRPHPAIALRVNDLQAYYAILTCPLQYAKSLAGFSFKEEGEHVL